MPASTLKRNYPPDQMTAESRVSTPTQQPLTHTTHSQDIQPHLHAQLKFRTASARLLLLTTYVSACASFIAQSLNLSFLPPPTSSSLSPLGKCKISMSAEARASSSSPKQNAQTTISQPPREMSSALSQFLNTSCFDFSDVRFSTVLLTKEASQNPLCTFSKVCFVAAFFDRLRLFSWFLNVFPSFVVSFFFSPSHGEVVGNPRSKHMHESCCGPQVVVCIEPKTMGPPFRWASEVDRPATKHGPVL